MGYLGQSQANTEQIWKKSVTEIYSEKYFMAEKTSFPQKYAPLATSKTDKSNVIGKEILQY